MGARVSVTRKRRRALIDGVTSFLVSAAIVLAPLPAMSADIGPLASGGAAGVRQAQAENYTPVFWLAGAGALVALGTMIVMNNNGGAIASGTLAPGGNAAASGQGSNAPGAMNGGSQSGSAGSSGNSAFDGLFIINSGGSPAFAVVTTTTTTTGTQ
jgi:hypothetical protein